MSPPVTFMVDTTGADADRLPEHLPAYGGYVSGEGGVEWTAEQFAAHPGSKVFKYYQGVGPVPPIHTFDVIDVEPGAVTAQQAADIVRERVAGGIPWTTIYGTDSALAQVSADVQVMGRSVWDGHVNCVLADWSLNVTEATDLIGKYIHGMSCVGVQYASPSSNPDTVIPGTGVTLRSANADMNVIDALWVPSGGFTTSVAPVAPPKVTPIMGVVVEIGTGLTVLVESTDTGITWHNR